MFNPKLAIEILFQSKTAAFLNSGLLKGTFSSIFLQSRNPVILPFSTSLRIPITEFGFNGRNLVIATKHEKEKVLAPILEKELGVKCFVAPELDTDKLGTFTGEIERKDDPITAARKKCLMAMELTHCDLAIASEGSFGPHPSVNFVSADYEFLLFMDTKNNLEIIARELSTETNFNGSEISTEKELKEFYINANFPSHALIIRKSKDDFSGIVKGINNVNELHSAFNNLMANYGTAYIETDMRAMNNPSRMKVIEITAKKLVEIINTRCPDCETPGFVITEMKKGLPCELCKFPTRGIISHVYTCNKCYYKKEDKYPNGKLTQDPFYCNVCNP